MPYKTALTGGDFISKVNDMQAIHTLGKEIRTLVNKLVSQSGFDKTFAGRVTGRSGVLHSVEVLGTVHQIKSSVAYAVNDSVWVTRPQNNVKDQFISGKRYT